MTKTCSNNSHCSHVDGPKLSLDEFGSKLGKIRAICKKCVSAYNSKRYRINKKYINFITAKYQKDNRKRCTELAANWRINNPDKVKVSKKRWVKENPSKVAQISERYRSSNSGKINARNAKYQLAKIQRTPKWLTLEDCRRMERKYEMASLMSDFLGVDLHVDHIIPLQGELVSGLHVPENLQILLASDNLGKSNKF